MERMMVKDLVEATGGTLLCGDPDTPVKNISINSQAMKGQDLFVPLIGEKVDAHRFIPQAFLNGAVAVLTGEHDEMDSPHPWIRVRDTKEALQAIGSFYRSRLTLPLVGVTGSVGKTTTREMIAAALSARFRVFRTPGNSNSQVGVPITLSEISSADEIGVIELGMSEPGELTVISRIARIDMAVITNIGITHIEQLGSRENIYREKMTIQDGLRAGGVLILNGDDDMLCHTKGKAGVRTLYYGTGKNCDFRAEDIRLVDGNAEFTAVFGDERQKIVLNVMGRHNVPNALAAVAVCVESGMTMEEAARGLSSFTGYKNRQQVYEKNGITVLDDTYNASPISMRAALDVLMSMKKGGRRIAVLADMKELGADAGEYHRQVGAYAAKIGVDMVAAYGKLAKAFAEGAKAEAFAASAEKAAKKECQTVWFSDKEELTRYLDGELRAGDCVLFKGSNSMRLSEVAARYIEK